MKFLTVFFVLSLVWTKPVWASSEVTQNQPVETNKSNTPKEWSQLKKQLKKRRTTLFSPILQRRLNRLQKVLEKDKKKGLEMIENMEKIVKNRPAEQAKLYLLKARVYLSLEKPKKALLYYQKAKNSKKLNLREHISLLYDMVQLHLLQKEIKQAEIVSDMLFFFSNTPYPPSLHILKAYILIEKNQKKEALKRVEQVLKNSRDPKEHWLALGAGLNFEFKNYVPALKLLLKLTAMKPQKKQYWKQLSSAYLNIDKNHKALATLDLAYKLDFLEKEPEIWHLASLLDSQGYPLKSALLLEKALKLKKVKSNSKNHEILGDLWQRAEEGKKALTHYQTAAVSAQNGKIFAKMARLHERFRNWKAVADNINKALAKGGVSRPENLYISLGTTYLQLKEYNKALKAFESVMEKTKAKATSIKQARQWLAYVQTLNTP